MRVELTGDGFMATGCGHIRQIVTTGPTRKEAVDAWIESAAAQQRALFSDQLQICVVCLQSDQACTC